MMRIERITPATGMYGVAIGWLSRAAAFRSVDRATIAALSQDVRLLEARSEAAVPPATARRPGLLFVLSGHAAVVAQDKVVELVGAGGLLGEENAFGCAGSTTTRLLYRSSALAVSADAVRSALDSSAPLARALMDNLSRRQLALIQRIECCASHRSLQRLGGFLLKQLPSQDASQHLRLAVPKATIASLLSMTKESLSRGLARLSEMALIAVQGRAVHVPCPARLAEACQCSPACGACDGAACLRPGPVPD